MENGNTGQQSILKLKFLPILKENLKCCIIYAFTNFPSHIHAAHSSLIQGEKQLRGALLPGDSLSRARNRMTLGKRGLGLQMCSRDEMQFMRA